MTAPPAPGRAAEIASRISWADELQAHFLEHDRIRGEFGDSPTDELLAVEAAVAAAHDRFRA